MLRHQQLKLSHSSVLHNDLIGIIIKLITQTPTDILTIRLVCQRWKTIINPLFLQYWWLPKRHLELSVLRLECHYKLYKDKSESVKYAQIAENLGAINDAINDAINVNLRRYNALPSLAALINRARPVFLSVESIIDPLNSRMFEYNQVQFCLKLFNLTKPAGIVDIRNQIEQELVTVNAFLKNSKDYDVNQTFSAFAQRATGSLLYYFFGVAARLTLYPLILLACLIRAVFYDYKDPIYLIFTVAAIELINSLYQNHHEQKRQEVITEGLTISRNLTNSHIRFFEKAVVDTSHQINPFQRQLPVRPTRMF